MFGRLVFLVLMGGVISQDFDSSLLTDIFGSQDGAMTEELEVAVIGSDKIKSNGTCRTEEGEDGRCILVKYCDVQETGYAKIELGDSRICNNYLETCCSTLKIRDVPNIPPVNQGGCGLRNPNGVMARLTTENEETQFGEFPWMVAVLKVVPDSSTSGTFNQYLCGGSLIHPSVVATVAHKIPLKYGNPDVASLRVRAGEWDTQTRDEPLQHQTRSIRNLVIHENLQRNNGIYDICLLFLELPMVLEPHIGVVCLPPPSDYPPLAYCTASGWGKDTLGPKGRYQQILKKADLQVVSRERCRMALRRTRLSSKFELHESLACAGGEAGQDTCEGDGGSPLVCNVPMSADRYMLAGIVSWGIGCGQSGIPGVYVNVPYLRSWIDQQLRKNYINMSPYQSPRIQ